MERVISRFLVVQLLILGGSHAAVAASGWTGESDITEIDTIVDQRVQIKLATIDQSLNCTNNKVQIVTNNDINRQQVVSIILSAYHAKQSVDVYVNDDANGNCVSDRVRVY